MGIHLYFYLELLFGGGVGSVFLKKNWLYDIEKFADFFSPKNRKISQIYTRKTFSPKFTQIFGEYNKICPKKKIFHKGEGV
jgi:hypothetical protein